MSWTSDSAFAVTRGYGFPVHGATSGAMVVAMSCAPEVLGCMPHEPSG